MTSPLNAIRKSNPYHVTCCAVLIVAALVAVAAPASGALSWQVDGSIGYMFVSEAQGTPWFKDTALPSVSIGLGGGTWLVGASADYSRRTTSFQGMVPGYTDQEETVDHQIRNTTFKAFGRYYPSGRGRWVAPYLGVGVGPGFTSVEYTGAFTSHSVSDREFRLSYAGAVGAQVNFKSLPVHTFLEVSYGGLAEISDLPEDSMVPPEELTYVSVAVGLGASF